MPGLRFHRVGLLVAITLLASIGAIPVAAVSDMGTISPMSDFGVEIEMNSDQAERHLRTHAHRTHKTPTTKSEERGISIGALAGAVSKKPSNQGEVDKLFLKLKLYVANTEVLKNHQFAKWFSAVEKGYLKAKMTSEQAERAIAATLATRYGDEGLVEMIVAAKKVAETKDVATKLESAQMKNWLNEKVSPEKAFEILKLDQDKYLDLERPLLKNWVSYMELRKDDPYKWLFERLRKLDDNNVILAALLGSAKQSAAASPIAQKVEELLLKSWMPSTAGDIFKRLELNAHDEVFFAIPRVRTWVSYVTKMNGQRADEEIFAVLRKYCTDTELATQISRSKEFSGDKFVDRMEEALEKVWLGEKKPARDVFTAFKLNTQGDKLFESSRFVTWAGYVTKLDEKNADELMLAVLKETFKDEAALTRMLAAAKDHDSTKTIAASLEKAQYKAWRSSGESADGLFKRLKLDDEVDDLLNSPVLDNWMAYVDDLGKDSTVLLLAKLKTSKLTKTDDKLAEMIAKAEQNEETLSVASKLARAEIDSWLDAKMTADDVFKLLKLDKEDTTLLWDVRVNTWLAFVKEKNAQNADELVYEVLKTYLKTDSKLANMLATGLHRAHMIAPTTELRGILLKMWKTEGKSADDVYDFVLKRHGQFIFQTPDFNTWGSYVMMVEKADPHKSMLEVLQRHFSEYKLGNMLDEAATTSKYAKDVAGKLREIM